MKSIAVLSVLVVIVLTACGSDDEPVDTGDGGGTSVDGDYRSVEVTEDGEDRPLVDDTVISLRLEDGELSADAGCNSIGGPYTVADGTFEVRGGLRMTEMGCDPDRMDQDSWLVDFLRAGPVVETTDHGFVLATDTTTIRFVDREVAEPDAELVGTTWTVTGFIDGDTAMSTSSSSREPAVLRLEENGFVTGHDGCNRLGYADNADPPPDEGELGLRYEVDGDEIAFEGDVVGTRMACDDPDVDRYHAVLTGTVTWEIEASNLTLLADDGRGVTFTAER